MSNETAAYQAITAEADLLGLPKAFMSDVYRHDNETTAKNPDLKFVWTIRDTGSNLFYRKASVDFWYPFLRGLENSVELIYTWDGARLTRATADVAARFLATDGR